MARPAAQSLNRASGLSSSRVRAAPTVAVQAPLDVNVGKNNLQGLAEILGVGANIAVSRAQQDSQRRVQEETELLASKAEADFHGGTFDEEQYRKSRTYRKTTDTLAGARQGVEGQLAMRKSVTDFVTANPDAGEDAVREQLEFARMEVLMGEDGQYKPEFQNERVRAIVEQALMDEGYKFISQWREPYVKRMAEKGAAEAEGLFIATGLSEGGTTVANMDASATQLRALGQTPDQINARIATATISLARQLRKPELIDQLPLAWGDGSVGPRADANLLATMDQQKTIITNLVESETREGQKWERFNFSSLVQEKIGRGELLTDEEVKTAIDGLGYAPEQVANWNDEARRTGVRLAEEAAKAAAKAAEDDLEFEEYLGDPYGFPTSKSEEILAVQWKKAEEAGDKRAMAQLLEVGSQNGHLPANLRRYLDNAPVNFNQFGQWRQTIQMIDQKDDELYASLDQDARVMYEAYNGLIASGRFSEQEAFRSIQTRDIKRGEEFVKSQSRGIKEMASGEGSLMASKIRERMLAFASLSDLDDTTVLQMTRESIEKDYITSNGRLLPRRYFPNEQSVTHAQMFFANEERKTGRVIDPDDVVVALPEGTSDVLFYDRRDRTRVRRLPVDRLVNERRAGAQRHRVREEAPEKNAQEAVASGLNPWRRIEGESTGSAIIRRNRELRILNRQSQARGGPTVATKMEWERVYGKPNQ